MKPNPPTTFRLDKESLDMIAQILRDHPYLKNASAAIRFALTYAPRSEPKPRCADPDCRCALVALCLLDDGDNCGIYVCPECSESALPQTITAERVIDALKAK